MTISVYHLDSFVYHNAGGNPAGVVLNADNLSEQQMQRIATLVGFSETAFVQSDTECDFHVQFFTPNSEVDFCGHATLATFALMFQRGLIRPQSYIQRTKAGKLAVRVSESGYVEMNQALPTFMGELNTKEIADSLNVSLEAIAQNGLPIEIISTGLADIIIPVQFGQLDNIKPDFSKISEISKKYNVIGYQVFELTPDSTEFDANCRNFAPIVNIDEESATGSACGALASYISKHRLVNKTQYVFEQGRAMCCSSLIITSVEKSDGKFKQIKVGGNAKLIRTIEIPKLHI